MHVRLRLGLRAFCVLHAFVFICGTLLSIDRVCGQEPAEAGRNWPQFRGVQASGVAGANHLPVHWDGPDDINIRWRTSIPGLGYSSPVIWGNRVFITTAVGPEDSVRIRIGLYGDIEPVDEDAVHQFRLICIDRKTGKVLWNELAHEGVPRVKRHPKSSHANPTPATDGKHVVAFFGSEGLYCYDMKGHPIWKKDLGVLDAAYFLVPTAQWGFASSPVIHEGKVIVQCDVLEGSFVAAFDLKTGEELWRRPRRDVPTWCTPTVVEVGGRQQVVVNGWHQRGAYDLETGEEIWWMDGGGDIPVPTPVAAYGLLFFSSAHGRLRPLYAIRQDASGDISLGEEETSNAHVAWSNPRRGAYLTTPLVHDGIFYVINNNGTLTAYRAETGEQLYRERAGSQRGAYSASLVAGGGHLYATDENGRIHVMTLGPEYRHVATNRMGEICIATPAISGEMLIVRTHRAVYAVENQGEYTGSPARTEMPKETRPKPVPVDLPKGELTDPTEILKVVDRVMKAVHTVRYEVTGEGRDAYRPYMPPGTAVITAMGFSQGTPEKFIVDLNYDDPRSGAPLHITAGSDGDRYYLIDHQSRSVHADFDFSIIGRYMQTIYVRIMMEFHLEEPFEQELACEKKTLLGTKIVEGEPCYEIQLVFTGERASESTWCFSKNDFLPRSRVDMFVLGNGQKGGMTRTFRHIFVEPELEPEAFGIRIPEGYSRTDDPAR